MAKKPRLTKEELEILEMVRCVSGVPLSTIHTVLEALSSVESILYANALLKDEKDKIVLSLPYVGDLVLQGDLLLVEWTKHSVLLKDLVNAKRAVREDDTTLFEAWKSRLATDLMEKL